MSSFTLHHGDCIEVMRGMAENSVDSIVTDPPYHLTSNARGNHAPGSKSTPHLRARIGERGFMGQTWDGGDIAHRVEMWVEALRVLKPGGHLLAFSGSRTYHRMTCAIEDAGFEIRDQIMWIYGSGFPKSRNGAWGGTALKPAHEPICMARKPLIGPVEANVDTYRTGALNIDACRVQTTEELRAGAGTTWDAYHRNEGRAGEPSAGKTYQGSTDFSMMPGRRGGAHEGRWPANVIHDGSEEVLAEFPDAKGQQGRVTGDEPTANGFSGAVQYSGMLGRIASSEPRIELDTSAARFFYCAKASRADRNEGLSASSTPALQTNATMRERQIAAWPKRNGNHHPTVKPTALMAYLCRLVTPAGGVVLDPFMGSGSTGKACMREGFEFIGIEMGTDYVDIAHARILHAQSAEQAEAIERSTQIDLFQGEAA